MLERCALAVCAASVCGYNVGNCQVLCDDEEALRGLTDGYGKPLFRSKCDCRASARAVIDALKEPTPGMENIWKQLDPVRFDHGVFHAAHRSMLQSILQSKEEGEGR